MAQSKHKYGFKSNNTESRSSSRQYITEGMIEQFQHCVIFNLRDSGLFANVCILWRRKTSFNLKEIELVNRLLNQYKQKHSIKSGRNIQFSLTKNASNLCLISGQLYDIIMHLRQKCSGMINVEEQPIPFIKLFQFNHIKHINQERIIDERQEYQTKGEIFILASNKAIAIKLEDAYLPGNKTKKHMTIFYRKKGWNDGEMKKIMEARDKWMRDNNKQIIRFSLLKWKGGNHSANIKGELFYLCWYLRNECKRLCSDQQPIPHVALWQ
eukprot:108391_1